MNGVNDAVLDFGFYLLHDGIKRRALPTQNDLLEDAVVAGGYNIVLKAPLDNTLSQFIPVVSQPYGEDIIKFLGATALMFGYRWSMGMERNIGGIMLKQLLAQGGQMIYKQL